MLHCIIRSWRLRGPRRLDSLGFSFSFVFLFLFMFIYFLLFDSLGANGLSGLRPVRLWRVWISEGLTQADS